MYYKKVWKKKRRKECVYCGILMDKEVFNNFILQLIKETSQNGILSLQIHRQCAKRA